MRQQLVASILAIGVAMGAAPAWSQTGVINYEDISQRKTRSTEREDRKKREAEEAKKKAEEAKRRNERQKRYEEYNNRDKEKDKGEDDKRKTGANDKKDDTTGTKAAAAGKSRTVGARSPATVGGSSDPTTQEVNEVILNAVQTRIVHFEPEKAADNPNVILLNKPKHDLKSRVRAGDTGMGEAL